MRTGGWIAVVVAAWVSAGCAFDDESGDGADAVAKKSLPVCKTKKDKPNKKPKKHEKDCLTTTTVGPAGGVVEHPGGVALTVPPGAVDHDIAITIRDDGAAGPPGTQMYSTVFTFEPDGTLFARPVTAELDVPDTVAASTVYWSRTTPSGIVWDRLPATVTAGIARSQITHFSMGGAGVPSDSLDLHLIESVTWDRLDSQHIERTDFAAGAAIAHLPNGTTLPSEVWNDASGNPVPGEGMIRNIPAGDLWIELAGSWIYTSLATTPVLDFSSEQFGTFGRATPDPLQTHPVRVHVTGAETTAPEDILELLVPDANAFYFGFPDPTTLDPVVPSGLTAFDLDWDLNSPAAEDNFITTADSAYFAQLSPRTTPAPASLPYAQMTKIGVAAPADVPQAGGDLTVALADLPPTDHRAYTIDAVAYQSRFAGPLDLMDPLSITANKLSAPDQDAPDNSFRVFNSSDLDAESAFFDLQGEAGGRNVGIVGATADFATISLPASVMTGPISTGDLSFGVPAGSWDTFAGLTGHGFFIIQLACPSPSATPCSTPGGFARQAIGSAFAAGFTDDELFDHATFSPSIGPVGALRLDGADASAIQMTTSLHPTISWTSDASLGAPQLYQVTVFHYVLDSSDGTWRTHRKFVATLNTAQTSFVLPFDLTPGGVYSFAVDAVSRDATAGIAPLAEPNRYRYPWTVWTTTSAPFRAGP